MEASIPPLEGDGGSCEVHHATVPPTGAGAADGENRNDRREWTNHYFSPRHRSIPKQTSLDGLRSRPAKPLVRSSRYRLIGSRNRPPCSPHPQGVVCGARSTLGELLQHSDCQTCRCVCRRWARSLFNTIIGRDPCPGRSAPTPRLITGSIPRKFRTAPQRTRNAPRRGLDECSRGWRELLNRSHGAWDISVDEHDTTDLTSAVIDGGSGLINGH
ncbi:unnamed protein product, partial [Iphiclides podalirius]